MQAKSRVGSDDILALQAATGSALQPGRWRSAIPDSTGLAEDWRKLLFPQADNAQLADGYAQAVTFGLLIARARDISLSGGTEMAAQELKKSNSLIGTALRLLTEDPSNQAALKTSLGTLTRVLDVVNWHAITKDDPKEWLYFCEQFLGETGGTFEQRAAQRFIDQIDHRRQRKARNCDLSSCANWRGSKRHSRAWIMTSSISSVLKRVRAQGILHERTFAHKYGFMEMRARP